MATARFTTAIEIVGANQNTLASAGRAQPRSLPTGEDIPASSGGIVEIGTSSEDLDVTTDIGVAGWAYFENVGDTNFIEVGIEVSAAFHAFARLDPGESAVVPLSDNAIFARADTAAELLRYLIVER